MTDYSKEFLDTPVAWQIAKLKVWNVELTARVEALRQAERETADQRDMEHSYRMEAEKGFEAAQAELATAQSGKAALAKIMDRIHDALGLTGQSYQPHQLPGKVQKLMERLTRHEERTK